MVEEQPKPEVQVLPDGRVLTYPPLSREEERILRVLAKGLFVSRFALSWAYYEAAGGNPQRINKLARRMGRLMPLQVMLVDESEEVGDESIRG